MPIGAASRRGLVELVAAVALLAASTALFAWGTLGWLGPVSEMSNRDRTPDVSSLVLYTNDPTVKLTPTLTVSPPNDGDGTAEGSFYLEIGTPRDPENFRWALIGRGRMAFQPKSQPIAGRVLSHHCNGSSRPAGNFEAGVVGSLDEVYQIGSSEEKSAQGWKKSNSRGSTMMLEIRFPNLSTKESGEQYSIELLEVGAPGPDNAVQIADMSAEYYASCVNLDTSTKYLKVGDLSAWPGPWNISASSKRPQDTLLRTSPESDDADFARWRSTGLRTYEATYSNEVLRRYHQWAVFVAGVLVGAATGFAVQGLTRLTSRPRSAE